MLINDSQWITYTTGEYKGRYSKYGNPSPYFRKTFVTEGKIARAELIASALGVYKIYINGKAVMDDYLSPGWVDYSKKLPFMRYDVTHLIARENAIGVICSDGWAVGHLGSNYTFLRNSCSDRIEFMAKLFIEYADGKTSVIVTDGSWRASSGEILRSDIYMGEYVDHRLSLGDFSLYDYCDDSWDRCAVPEYKFSRNLYLEEMKVAPIVVKHTFKPEPVSNLDYGKETAVYDVGQNISGVLRLRVKGERGSKIVIRHGELLFERRLYTENLRKAEATDTYVLSGEGEEIFRPLFTFHGFRYAEITVYGKAVILDVTAEAMYSDLSASGEFQSSHPIMDKVYQNSLWGQRDNFLNVPTDCPQRDERLGWTGDAQIFSKSAMWNMDSKVFYEKYLSDVRDAQLGNGVIPAVAPLPHVGFYDYSGYEAAAGWCEVIAEIPYQHYIMYGDKRVIRDNLPALKKLIDYYEYESPDGIRDKTIKYGDWLSLGTPTDLGVVATLYYARAAKLASLLCSAVGDFEEDYYSELYLKIKDAFRKRYISSDGKIESDTQSAYVIAYKFGIIDIDEARKNLVRKFETDDGGKLTTGFLGIRFLLPTLCDIGRADIAYRLISSTEYPGWGYSIKNGATTIWEHWDSYTEEGGIKKGMNSFNHYSFGSCTEWMYEYSLGINPSFESCAFQKVRFSPYFDPTGEVKSCKGSYLSPYGKISVSWEKKNAGFEYRLTLPEGLNYELDFRDMKLKEEKISGEELVFILE